MDWCSTGTRSIAQLAAESLGAIFPVAVLYQMRAKVALHFAHHLPSLEAIP